MPRMTLRLQLMLIFIALCSLAAITTTILLVSNARSAINKEVNASHALAHSLINESISSISHSSNVENVLKSLKVKFRQVRHIRIGVFDRSGNPVNTAPVFFFSQNGMIEEVETVPDWFYALLWTASPITKIPINVGMETFGMVTLAVEPGDEIAEIWADIKILMKIAIFTFFSLLIAIHFALGQALKPIDNIISGLFALMKGNYRFRIDKIASPELSRIGEGFNKLANKLETISSEREKLSRRLITVQDQERRYIAQELHDEFGPCLFGIKSNASSLNTFFKGPNSSNSSTMKEKVGSILEIIKHMEMCNRDLLNQLRPMALGEITLSELIEKLVATYQHRHNHINWNLQCETALPSFGETIDLTVYRFIQESLTNVVRHAEANNVRIELYLDELIPLNPETTERFSSLNMIVIDDGKGFGENSKVNHGISGLEERIEALGGTLSITRNTPTGVKLEARLQIPMSE